MFGEIHTIYFDLVFMSVLLNCLIFWWVYFCNLIILLLTQYLVVLVISIVSNSELFFCFGIKI